MAHAGSRGDGLVSDIVVAMIRVNLDDIYSKEMNALCTSEEKKKGRRMVKHLYINEKQLESRVDMYCTHFINIKDLFMF